MPAAFAVLVVAYSGSSGVETSVLALAYSPGAGGSLSLSCGGVPVAEASGVIGPVAYASAVYRGMVEECTLVYSSGGRASGYTFRVPTIVYQYVWGPADVHSLLLLPTGYEDSGSWVRVTISSAKAGGRSYIVTVEQATTLPRTCTQPVCIYAETIGTDSYLVARFEKDSATSQASDTIWVKGILRLESGSNPTDKHSLPFSGAISTGAGHGVFATARIGPARGEITIEVPVPQTHVPDYVAVGFELGGRTCTAIVNLQPYVERR